MITILADREQMFPFSVRFIGQQSRDNLIGLDQKMEEEG